jgi:hypothetical protein
MLLVRRRAVGRRRVGVCGAARQLTSPAVLRSSGEVEGDAEAPGGVPDDGQRLGVPDLAGELDGSGEVAAAGLVERSRERPAAGGGDGEDPVELRVVSPDRAGPGLDAFVRSGGQVGAGAGALAPADAKVEQVELAGGASDGPHRPVSDRSNGRNVV